ncbi:uncharacterized protein B0H18DRAFT_1196117 [Fomitopsis serialis]|uniref:uncharacterized protein n=1 Tax=Fomitopsis serialis TaxID=139415 RepID=UPI002007E7D8|nr:uncharacterized protein B0H18DRAFT_1196117 [Neoantrodia serialis]KAH9919291.1 hypothetical protein B0H18DRAFT_1196117 [Neoantrodia serialis]
MASLEEQLRSLRSCIYNKPPYYSGTLKLPADDFLVFYGKDDNARCGISAQMDPHSLTHSYNRRIDLSSTTEEGVKHLAESCDAATFGMNNRDVLDESYRKAGKLDRKHFSPVFNPASTGLLRAIETELVEANDKLESPSIRAELYKLNVYGPGSFFKAHQDTPRTTDMFGSLVIVYPTAHEGGALALRHGGKEWTFDSSKIFAQQEEPCLAYIAFFSDIEHEVLEVQSGYRITITYNLYHVSSQPSLACPSVRPLTFEPALKAAIRRLLDDRTFLPNGGHLGFCLTHQYPVGNDCEVGRKPLSEVPALLRGSDAVIAKTLGALNLRYKVRVVVEETGINTKTEDGGTMPVTAYVMFNHVIDIEDTYVEEQFFQYLREIGGKLVNPMPPLYAYDEAVEPDILVRWVVHPSDVKGFKTRYVAAQCDAYPSMQYTYLCLIVAIGDIDSRSAESLAGTQRRL